jgi:ribosomal protein S18 acetylase RimI-like enzyme
LFSQCLRDSVVQNNSMFIDKAVEATDEILSALKKLIPQLGVNKPYPSQSELTALIESEASSLLIARYPNESGEIVGALTLAIYRVPTGVRSVVEDVVVDEQYRNKGIAKALMTRAIELAREAGASNVSLTSNPSREAANSLYRNMGFQQRETNLYIFHLK